jgi:molybdopterin converting factor small subunit
MQITFKLYATLQHLLPADAKDNAVTIEVPEQITLHEVIDRFNVQRKDAHLVLINGRYIGGSDRDEKGLLTDGDVLAVWPPVAGG